MNPIDPDHLDQAVLMLVSGRSAQSAESQCMARFGMTLADAKAAVVEARQVITLAADYNRDEQFGLAVKRLNDLYCKSMDDEEYLAALAAQKEINRMMGLYDKASSGSGVVAEDPSASSALQRVRDHLLPLGLASEAYPVDEHARLAALAIMEPTRQRKDG